MRALGINAIVHDPAAAEEERFSRRKHGGRPVPRRGGSGLDRIMKEEICGSR
ncbi:hypothetical protein [Micromonospora marina]|uniref:hypothetical protein n=1 Tax=Micromonospora marina TaxID=307120 RepID=UPI003D754D79